ncbi:MAG: bifunctional phosphopantothenoylcysteine decarboxylase/phosphopantothenate--cysteine ligase CoaBC [Gemmatimonadota bacterium]
MSWSGRHVVLGVSGGIASYKSCYLARRLTEAGARVDVVLTQGAAEFVGPVTFEALTDRPVVTSLWDRGEALAHVRLGTAADLILVAPATAHLIARAAHGLADDFLTTLLLAGGAPTLFAPAMNDEMFAHPATQANVDLLRLRGCRFVGPEAGALAEGPSSRPGRMSEPETIMAHAARLLAKAGPLKGKRVLITAGPTREALDPVRVISNRSSGRMGYRLAEAAWERGAEVTLISGPVEIAVPAGVEVIRVESTADLESAVSSALPAADVFIMAAAPADYRPAEPSKTKRARSDGPQVIQLEATRDILDSTTSLRKPGAVTVGFALETGNAVARGQAKLEKKKLDMIVVNDALEPGAGFEVDTNRVTLISRGETPRDLPLQSKRAVADAILDAIETRLV